MANSHIRSERTADDVGTSQASAMWDIRYVGSEYLFGTEPNDFLRIHSAVWQTGSRILCVADGEGRNSVWLARQGLHVDAFDVSEVGVAKARKLADSHGVSVQFDIADCDNWPWPEEAYDGVAAIFVQFADPAMRQRLFRNMMRCLKPGGTLILQGYTPQQLTYRTGGPAELSHLYTTAMLAEAFTGANLIELREYEADLCEGIRHKGRSALIGLIAKKQPLSV